MALMVSGQSARAVRLGRGDSSSVPQSVRIRLLCFPQFSGESAESCWLWCPPVFLLLWVLRKHSLALEVNAVNPEDFKSVSYLKTWRCSCCRGKVDQCVELTPAVPVSDLSLQFRSNS